MQKETAWGQSVGKCNFLMTLSIFNHGNAFGRIREIKFADSDNVQFWGKTAEKKHAVDYRACGRWSIWERLIVCEQRKLPRQNAFPSNAQGDLAAGAFHWHLTTSGLICFEKQLQKQSVYKMIFYQWKRLTVQLSVVWLAAVVRFSRTNMDCSWNVLALWPHHTTLVEGIVCAR